MKAIWITWEAHRRTQEIARALGIELFELSAPAGWRRYPSLLIRTTRCLVAQRPTHLFIQCPSVVLAVWVALLKPLLRYALIADLHNEAVRPFINLSGGYARVLRFIHSASDVNLVTNERLVTTVDANGGPTMVLPDRVPVIHADGSRHSRAGNLVVFVCTFAPDEPFAAVIAAAGILGDAVQLRITGNPRKVAGPLALPSNVTLTGFLPAAEYDRLLDSADVIVDLTSMEDCLVCGAYEAAALGKPLVTSDTAALRATFSKGAEFTAHDAPSIAAAVARALDARLTLARDMRARALELEVEWQARRAALVSALAGVGGRARAGWPGISPDYRNGERHTSG